MSNDDYVVGRAYGEMAPPQTAIYEALLEKAQRELNEIRKERDDWKRMYEEADWKTVEAETYKKELMETRKDRNKWGLYAENIERELMESRKENQEQARLLGSGGSREARLITERDHYKQAIEEISTTIDDWLNSLVQEPSLDFIHAIKAWADKKLKEV